MTRVGRTLLVPVLLLTAMGCADPLTQIIVVVDTDVPLASPNPLIVVPNDHLREISLSLYGPCDPEGATCPPVFEDSAQQYNMAGSVALPFSIGLLLEDETQPGPYRFHVDARLGQPPDEALITIDALFGFAVGESRVLPLYVVSSCADQGCGAGQSCGTSGSCETEVRSPETLPVWTGVLEDFALSPGG